MAAAQGNGDTAQSAIQSPGGALVFASPFQLGSLADDLGPHTAFAVDLLLIGAAAILPATGPRAGAG